MKESRRYKEAADSAGPRNGRRNPDADKGRYPGGLTSAGKVSRWINPLRLRTHDKYMLIRYLDSLGIAVNEINDMSNINRNPNS